MHKNFVFKIVFFSQFWFFKPSALFMIDYIEGNAMRGVSHVINILELFIIGLTYRSLDVALEQAGVASIISYMYKCIL